MAVGPIPAGKAATKTVKAAIPIASIAGKTKTAKTTTTKATPNFSQSLNLYGTPSQNTRTTTTDKKGGKKGGGTQPKVGKETGATNTFIPGIVSLGNSGGSDDTTPTAKTIVSRIPRLDSKGKIIGWDLIYSDGTTGFESNPA
jgi:hypothetical protein